MIRAVKFADTLQEIPTALAGSFVEEEATRRRRSINMEEPLGFEELKTTMAKNWSGVEDMAEVKNAEIEESLEEIDKQVLLSGEETAVEEMMDEEEDDDHGEAAARKEIIPTDQDVLKAIQTIQMYGCAKNANVMQATARQLRTDYLTIRQRSSVQQATLTNYFFNVPVVNKRDTSAAAVPLTTADTSDDSKSI
jgi:hypothetical protein